MGSNFIAMSNAAPQVLTNLNTFVTAIAGQSFSTFATQIHAVFPHVMFLGPDSMSGYNIPPSAPTLRAAALYVDAFMTANFSLPCTEPEMDYIEANYGDKPYFASFYTNANPDSAMSQYPLSNPTSVPGFYSTQAARGAAYYSQMLAILQTATPSDGSHPYIGTYWFAYTDSGNANWGVVTPSDNLYDAFEATATTVTSTLGAYSCGGEDAPGGWSERPPSLLPAAQPFAGASTPAKTGGDTQLISP